MTIWVGVLVSSNMEVIQVFSVSISASRVPYETPIHLVTCPAYCERAKQCVCGSRSLITKGLIRVDRGGSSNN